MGRTRTPEQPQRTQADQLGAISAAITAGVGASLVADTLRRLYPGASAANSATAAAYVAKLGVTSLVELPRAARGGQDRFTAVRRAGSRAELLNRARYVRGAFKRGLQAYRAGEQDARIWRKNERYWHRLHVQAQRNRQRARGRCDKAAQRHGVILGWECILDRSTTQDCREMHGKNFDVTRPPRRGLPGTVHGFCRCVPVAPYPNVEVVYD